MDLSTQLFADAFVTHTDKMLSALDDWSSIDEDRRCRDVRRMRRMLRLVHDAMGTCAERGLFDRLDAMRDTLNSLVQQRDALSRITGIRLDEHGWLE